MNVSWRDYKLNGMAQELYSISVSVHCANNGCNSKFHNHNHWSMISMSCLKMWRRNPLRDWSMRAEKRMIKSAKLGSPSIKCHRNMQWQFTAITYALNVRNHISEEVKTARGEWRMIRRNLIPKNWSVPIVVQWIKLKLVANMVRTTLSSNANSAAKSLFGSVGIYVYEFKGINSFLWGLSQKAVQWRLCIQIP